MKSSELKTKSVLGFLWSLIRLVGIRGLNFCSTIILARILEPSHFGLIGMVAVFIGLSQTLLTSGFGKALLQQESVSEKDYSTVQKINLALSVFLYGLIYFFAPQISVWYSQEILSPILRLLGIILILNAISFTHEIKLKRQLNFKRLAVLQIPASLLSIVISIYLAYSGYGVWSLVWQQVLQRLFYTILIQRLSITKTGFDIIRAKELFSFGGYLLLGGLINTFFKNIYIIIIAKTHSVILAGYFQFSMNLISQTSNTLTNAITGVAFPSFSRIQKNTILLVRSLEKLISLVVSVFIPLYVAFIVFSNPIFENLFGDKWIEALPYFKALCIIGILIPLNAVTSDIVNIMGRSDVYFRSILLKKIITLTFLVFLYKSDIMVLIYLRIFDGICALIINAYFATKFIKLNWISLFKKMIVVVLTTLVATIIARRLMQFGHQSANSFLMCSAVLGYVVVWSIGFGVTHKSFVVEIIRKI